MPQTLLIASSLFTAALFFYSVGVWAERISKRLKPWHAVSFFLGVVTDTLATGYMTKYAGRFIFNTHSFIGAAALLLMIFHLGWAVIVLRSKDEKALTSFHKFSVFVWLIWMVAYLSGAWLGMQRIG